MNIVILDAGTFLSSFRTIGSISEVGIGLVMSHTLIPTVGLPRHKSLNDEVPIGFLRAVFNAPSWSGSDGMS